MQIGRRARQLAAWMVAASWWSLTTAAVATSPAALLTQSPAADPLSRCIQQHSPSREALTSARALSEGLEFRLSVEQSARGTRILVLSGYVKPDVSALIDGHDADPEAQLAAALPFYHQLRVPLGTRVWVLGESGLARTCREAAAWISTVRSRPVRLDRTVDAPRSR